MSKLYLWLTHSLDKWRFLCFIIFDSLGFCVVRRSRCTVGTSSSHHAVQVTLNQNWNDAVSSTHKIQLCTMPENGGKKIHLHSFDFPRQQKLFCVIFFLCLFLTKNMWRARKYINNSNATLFEWSESKKKIHRLSHVASNMQQTRARFALRSKHFQWLKQKFFEQEYLIQFCFIINCSVKYFGRHCLDDSFDIVAEKGIFI